MHLSTLEKEIIRQLSSSIEGGAELSLTEFARSIHVSKSSVVRAIQKCGFKGFSDFSFSLRLYALNGQSKLFPQNITVNSKEEALVTLVDAIRVMRGKRNFVFVGDRNAELIGRYFSRKLSMFDIFCPATYDSWMADPFELEVGIGFFFLFQTPSKTPIPTGQVMFQKAQYSGFKAVVISNEPPAFELRKNDRFIQIYAASHDLYCDFASRCLVLIEEALSIYSKELG